MSWGDLLRSLGNEVARSTSTTLHEVEAHKVAPGRNSPFDNLLNALGTTIKRSSFAQGKTQQQLLKIRDKNTTEALKLKRAYKECTTGAEKRIIEAQIAGAQRRAALARHALWTLTKTGILAFVGFGLYKLFVSKSDAPEQARQRSSVN